jgi:hypothetical protein
MTAAESLSTPETFEECLQRFAYDGYQVKVGWYPKKMHWSAWVRRLDKLPPEEVDFHAENFDDIVTWMQETRRVGV